MFKISHTWFGRQRLLFKAYCMERVLKPDIKHKIFYNLIVRQVKKFLDDVGIDNDVDRGVWRTVISTIKEHEMVPRQSM